MFRGVLKQFFRLGMPPVEWRWVYPRAVRLKIRIFETVWLRCERILTPTIKLNRLVKIFDEKTV